jgi:NAD(P)-dependent dehydrogenase (short-subunit alcohol dehydrogenase family)
MTANTAYRHIAAYSAAKGGLQSLMKTLMVEFGDDSIRFNSLAHDPKAQAGMVAELAQLIHDFAMR